jgi:DNA modification methylase
MCGDATKIEDVEKLMDGKKAQLIMSDPPYNVDYTGGSTNEEKRKDSYKDEWTDQEYTEFLRLIWSNSFVASDEKSALLIWFASAKMRSVMDGFEQSGWLARTLIVWNKLNAHYGALGAQYKHKFEPLWYCYKKGQAARFYGETNETTVWDYDQPSKNDLHPTMKPVGLYVRAIKNHSEKNDNVYENFGGSGTTLIACEEINRTCYMMEIDPKYCDVIRKRYAKLINKEEEWKEITHI